MVSVDAKFFVPVQLLSLLLEALSCPDQGVQLSTLSCLEPVLADPPQALIQQLEALVNRLLALICSPAMVSETEISHLRVFCPDPSEFNKGETKFFMAKGYYCQKHLRPEILLSN